MKYFATAFIILLFSFSMSEVSAHAGVQKRSGDIVVTFYQSPISPLVGEEVNVTFSVSDLDYNPRRDLEGKLLLIKNFYGDESKDKQILTQAFTTDANGSSEFSYTFEKENFYTIELQFEGRENKSQHIDYLIQPRMPGQIITRTIQAQSSGSEILKYFFGGVLVSGLSYILAKRLIR